MNRWVKGGLAYTKHMIFLVALLVFSAAVSMAEVTIEKVSYGGWNDCYRISNGEVELIAVADIGPRIIHFGYVNEFNLFSVTESDKGTTGGDRWKGYGGHRFWIAPEDQVITYYPDNYPVDARIVENTLILTSIPEIPDADLREKYPTYESIQPKLSDPLFRKNLGIQKSMSVSMDDEGRVTITHQARNRGDKPFEMAPWALTVMAKGGLTIVPNPPYAPHGPGHFLPVRGILLWSYTNLADPRLSFMRHFTTVQQNPEMSQPIKIGFSETGGWVAYALKERLFVKNLGRMKEMNIAEYPDMGASVELFTNASIMEIESLGPMRTLKTDEMLIHTERWRLFKIPAIQNQEESIQAALTSIGLVR